VIILTRLEIKSDCKWATNLINRHTPAPGQSEADCIHEYSTHANLKSHYQTTIKACERQSGHYSLNSSLPSLKPSQKRQSMLLFRDFRRIVQELLQVTFLTFHHQQRIAAVVFLVLTLCGRGQGFLCKIGLKCIKMGPLQGQSQSGVFVQITKM
jgi:hypothetical protein